MGTCGIGNGAREVFAALGKTAENRAIDAQLTPVGCFGFCAPNRSLPCISPAIPLVVLGRVAPADAGDRRRHRGATPPLEKALCRIGNGTTSPATSPMAGVCLNCRTGTRFRSSAARRRSSLRDCGLINPRTSREYIAIGGYHAFYQATQKANTDELIEEVKKAKLRGRGGAGYPTGVKWDLLKKAVADRKYIICNADEGDPGAFMNRNGSRRSAC